jgi:TPP-dependent pyruvate/acetoin dehydrogenase alpha subunit
VDGTDACQVYDAAHEACQRARGGEGPTLIEAKMMRMKGHAIHDAADYVPQSLVEYWRKRDPIARFEAYLLEKQWLTPRQNQDLIAGVDRELEADREFAVRSPMPQPESAAGGLYCNHGCHDIRPKYGIPKVTSGKSSRFAETPGAVHLK